MKPIATPMALSLAGLSIDQWQHIVPMFKGAPSTTAGRVRYFDRDDCVTLFVIDHLVGLGFPCKLVGQIATDARLVLVTDDVDTLWITTDLSDLPIRVSSTEPTDKPRLAFPVTMIRDEVERFAAALQ